MERTVDLKMRPHSRIDRKHACALQIIIILSWKSMRITIDIDEKDLTKIQKFTGQKKKSPAVCQALDGFLRQQARREFIARALSGKTDFALTNDELEARDFYEARR